MSKSDHQSPTEEKLPMLTLNPDGSCTRNISFPSSTPTHNPDSDVSVLSKDVTINQITKAWVRIYLPKQTQIPTVKRLPLIVFYHSGGFVLSTAASTLHHDFCNQLAIQVSVMVVSVDYRNAPEHRLPAAYDDGVEALYWIKSTEDPWLINFCDLSNCYLMGTSAGANLAYVAGLRVSKQIHDLEPLKIKGLIIHNLFIGGVERTSSELGYVNPESLTLAKSDLMWDLCLPVGASRDHEYCNLLLGDSVRDMDVIKDLGWRVMIAIRNGDILIDRQKEFAKTLESKGVEVHFFNAEGDHAIEVFDKSKALELFDMISCFLSMNHVQKN